MNSPSVKTMLLGDIFERDVTRTIPPVVYFHEQEPSELKREVEEYIITGGYPEGDDRATPDGIHEQFVRLLTGIRNDLDQPQVGLPACWISGYYGSGKSSFAKLLGLSLNGMELGNGQSLAQALLAQDHSPKAAELRQAWESLQQKIKPLSVVFDVGTKARGDEHVHSVVLRQVQIQLGYSRESQLVAEYELKLEREGLYDAFMDKVTTVLDRPWSQVKDSQLVEDEFSAVMHAMRPDLFPEPTSWVFSRVGSEFGGTRAADDVVAAIAFMLEKRRPGRTLFVVIDEVSQYLHEDNDRQLALQSFVSALGQRLKGKVWILATGQQKLEEGAGPGASIAKLKDRFPTHLRVHLGVANIRDVVHKRLLRKKSLCEADLRDLFAKHRPDLSLYAFEGDSISETAFVEIYPLLPNHVDLLLDITTGLRSRSARTQGDAYAIRGLLQLLGDLFREHKLANRELGCLVTLDLVYDALHSALGPDVQLTIGRALELAQKADDRLMAKVVKAVSMLELVQDQKGRKTTAELVARCLYERLGQGSILTPVQIALDTLAGHGLLALSEKTGYKIESAAGQQWQHERDTYQPTGEAASEQVRKHLAELVGREKAVIEGLELPWLPFYSDDLGARDLRLKNESKPTVVAVDFRYTRETGSEKWIPLSNQEAHQNRFLWIIGDTQDVESLARKGIQSARQIGLYDGREGMLSDDQRRLLIEERNRLDSLNRDLRTAIETSFLAGKFYFRGGEKTPSEYGLSFQKALSAYGAAVARQLYPKPITFSVKESEILYLIENRDLAAPPKVLGQEGLGLLSLDAGRYEVSCRGQLPTDVLALVAERDGVEGSTLLAHFGGPPHGIAPDLIRATLIGLLRATKVRIEVPGVGEFTSVQDEGMRELLKETALRKAKITINRNDPLLPRDRNAICMLFKDSLQVDVARDNDAIADAVANRFAGVRDRLNEVAARFRKLPRSTEYPEALSKLEDALESCRRSRQVEPTLRSVKSALPVLRDGLTLLRRMETDLTAESAGVVSDAVVVLELYVPALLAGHASEEVQAAIASLKGHLEGPRPWENTGELAGIIDKLKAEYRVRRRAVLDHHAKQQQAALEELRGCDGFDRLDTDQQHRVRLHVREGGAANTDENAVAPPLEVLPALLRERLAVAHEKALKQLSSFLEAEGGPVTVELAIDFRGREIKSEAELERFLEDLRRRVLHELSAKHHVRLK